MIARARLRARRRGRGHTRAALWALGVRRPHGRAWPWLEAHGPGSAMAGQMLERGLNCPASTSLGRLFDAAAALAGAGLTAEYEAQAAIRLEHSQYGVPEEPAERAYPLPLLADQAPALLDSRTIFRALYADWKAGTPTGTMARRFHQGLVIGLAAAAAHFAAKLDVRTVGLSGGCLLNLTLAEQLPAALRQHGLTVLTHIALPPGDACISLGQADWGRRMLASRALPRGRKEK